ncbi:MAG: hypothetical protein A2042_03830 [Candidatus Schekmanbacteria bacterium GWA2_38_11]|uniref:RNA-binding protein KhpB n=1 Tax=Candidatus Schekmanbacteria bacterium GWA2_38_11 TaxID=1817876 RepID=A0A1F7RPD5_9BACT|nr:MAG: hypothetical protein A2042_03830 [Candidatus Schekmanbacteria bacterium GWA2_38_11]
MKITEEGKTPQEAIEKVIKKLGISRDQIKVEIIEKGSKGILGIMSKPAKIEVTVSNNGIEYKAKKFIEKVLEYMDFPSTLNVKREKELVILEIYGQNTGLLIGKKGQTLEALQHILDRFLNREDDKGAKILIDIEGYREKREEALKNLALRVAKKVKSTGVPTTMMPMNPKERRIVHMALNGDKGVKTVSRGNGTFRRIVVYPSNQQVEEKQED